MVLARRLHVRLDLEELFDLAPRARPAARPAGEDPRDRVVRGPLGDVFPEISAALHDRLHRYVRGYRGRGLCLQAVGKPPPRDRGTVQPQSRTVLRQGREDQEPLGAGARLIDRAGPTIRPRLYRWWPPLRGRDGRLDVGVEDARAGWHRDLGRLRMGTGIWPGRTAEGGGRRLPRSARGPLSVARQGLSGDRPAHRMTTSCACALQPRAQATQGLAQPPKRRSQIIFAKELP